MSEFGTIWDDVNGPSSGKIEDPDIQAEHNLKFKAIKSQEEIEKLTLDENISPLDRAFIIIKGGNDLQKQFVIKLITSKSLSVDNTAKLFKAFLQDLSKATIILQTIAAEAFQDWLDRCTYPRGTFDDSIKFLRDLTETKNRVLQIQWMDVFVGIIPFLSQEKIEKEIITDALHGANIMQPVHYRMWSCKLIGKISCFLDPARSEILILDTAVRLCQNTELDIRECMALQLKHLCQSLASKSTVSILIEELMELVKDEEVKVNNAAFNSLMEILAFASLDKQKPTFNKDILSKILYPAVKKAYIASSTGITAIHFKEIGRALVCLDETLSSEEFSKFIAIFIKGCRSSEDSVRQMCAYNVPAILKVVNQRATAASNTSPEDCDYNKMINDIDVSVLALSKDSNNEVRFRMAKGLPSMSTELGANSLQRLQLIYKRLLEDSNIVIVSSLLESVDTILVNFSSNAAVWQKQTISLTKQTTASSMGYFSNHAYLDDLLRTIKRLISNPRLQKQKQVYLFKPWARLNSVFSPEHVYYHLVTFLIFLLKENPSLSFECETEIIGILVSYMRDFTKGLYRESMQIKITETFLATTSTSRSRLLFLRFVETVISVYSAKYVKQNLLTHCMSLRNDPVIAVRYKMAMLLPVLLETLIEETDKKMIQSVCAMVSSWRASEKDAGIKRRFAEYTDLFQCISPKQSVHDKEKQAQEDDLQEQERLMEQGLQGVKEISKKINTTNRVRTNSGTRHGSIDKSMLSSMTLLSVKSNGSLGSGSSMSTKLKDKSNKVPEAVIALMKKSGPALKKQQDPRRVSTALGKTNPIPNVKTISSNNSLKSSSSSASSSSSLSSSSVSAQPIKAASTTTAAQKPTSSLFGQPSTTTKPNAGTSSLFGSTVAGPTATSTNTGGIFGTSTTAQTQPAASGGLFPQQQQSVTASFDASQVQKQTKYNDLPDAVQKKLDSFHKLVTEQSHIGESMDISFTADTISQVDRHTAMILDKFMSVRNMLDRDAHLVNLLKTKTNKEVDHLEVASRLFEAMMKHGGPGAIGIAERPFYHPQDYVFRYFQEQTAQMESRLLQYQSLLEEAERMLATIFNNNATPQQLSPAVIGDIMRNNYSIFIAIASKVANVHEQIELECDSYVKWRRSVLNDDRNPFEKAAEKSRAIAETPVDKFQKPAKLSDIARRITQAPPTAAATSSSLLSQQLPATSLGSSFKPTTSLFGPSQTSTGGLFAQSTTAAAAPSTKSLFQQPSTTATTTGGSLFGQSTQQPQSGLFGQSTQPQQPQSGLFGQSTQQQPQQQATGLFGQSTQQQPQQQTTGLFGQSTQQQASGLFGQSTQQQPQQQQQPSIFGAPAAPAPSTTTPGLFGSFGASAPPPPPQPPASSSSGAFGHASAAPFSFGGRK